MVFWFWNVLAIAIMMAVLSLAVEYKGSADVLITPTTMMISVVLTLLVCAVLAWQTARPTPRRHPWRVVYAAIFVGLFGLSLGLFGLRAYQIYQHDAIIRPTSPIQVQAIVEIHELSDGVYDKAYEDKAAGLSYRQKAIIRDIRPLNTNDIQPDAMAVLLYAKALPVSTVQPDGLAALSSLKVGQQAVMTLNIKPLVEEQRYGFDSFRWLVSRHVHATADVVAIDESSIRTQQHISFTTRLQQARAYYRELFYPNWQNADLDNRQALAITLSLLTGDRALIDKATYELYQYGGIMHLLAISGTHVLFLAVLLASLAVRVVEAWLPSLYRFVARWQFRFIIMVAAAFVYALFVGFEVPAVRTVLMLIVAGVARWLLVSLSSMKVLAVSAVMMAYHDPYVLWQAGFWLSVVAVAVLLHYEMVVAQSRLPSSLSAKLWTMIRLQLYVFMAMLPISLLLFGQVSPLGAVVNLVAVGLFGWLIVPLNLLAGILAVLSPTIAWLIWQLLVNVLAALAAVLAYLKLIVGESWIAGNMSVAVLLLFGMATLLLRGDWLPRRFASLPLMAAILAMVQTPQMDGVQVVVFEDSNSSQVLIHTRTQAWLVMAERGRLADNDRLAKWLYQKLSQQGISRLDGVIIQDDSDKLLFLTKVLAAKMPVAAVWWAGDERRDEQLLIKHCQADIGFDLGREQIVFMTGWQDVPLPDCAVMIHGPSPSQIAAYLPDKSVNLTYQNTALIIDNNNHVDTWAIYNLLCQNNDKITNITPNVILTHSSSTLNAAVYEYFGNPKVVFNHHLNATQKQAANLSLGQLGVL